MDEKRPPFPERAEAELIAIGYVRKPFGLKGQFYADAFGKALGMLRAPKKVFCGRDEANTVSITLVEIRETPRGFLGRFEGSETVEDAERFRGIYMFLEKSKLPSLKNNEYYHFELEGMAVVTELIDKSVGVVTEMQSFPTTDALMVRKEDGSTILIPMNKDFIKKIDRDKGCIVVNASALEDIVS
jgi:16S rRNA processing protein RimM